MEGGAPANKLVMGMPLYGQAFTLDKESENGLNAPARSKGKAGEFTRAAGFLAYYEICDKVKSQGWTVVEDSEGRLGPYAHQGRNWVGYDDVAMIKYKSEYIRYLFYFPFYSPYISITKRMSKETAVVNFICFIWN